MFNKLRNFFIPKIIFDFRTDLHKMKINTELCSPRFLCRHNFGYEKITQLVDNIPLKFYGL
jgi:hypothetical protein